MIFEIGDLISEQKDVQTEEILTGFAKSLTLTILDYHRKAQQSEATVWILIGMQKFHISLGARKHK